MTVQTEGQDGADTANILLHMKQLFQQAKFDVVIVQGGTNDVGMRHEPKEVMRNLEAMYNLAREGGAFLIATTIPEAACDGFDGQVSYSGSVLAEISVTSPRKLLVFIIRKNIFLGWQYPKNILSNFENRSTGELSYIE